MRLWYKKRKISLLGQKYLIVRRNFGWYKRRFGIIFDYLLETQKRLLKEHKFIKYISDDDQTMYIIFQISEMEDKNKGSRKLWYNPYKDKVSDYRTLKKDSKLIDWNCAICNSNIESNIENFEPSNFLCTECLSVYVSKNGKIDSRIVESSVKFTNHCKVILRKEQKSYIRYLRKNVRLTAKENLQL